MVPEAITRRVLLNLDRCIECRSCAAACSYGHASPGDVWFARSGWAILPTICRQCREAPCVSACPAEAMVRDDLGVVRRRAFCCTGCGSCAAACPFGVMCGSPVGVPPVIRSDQRMSGPQVAKCDLCQDRTASGGTAVPRCVAACPAGALVFADPLAAQQEGMELVGGRTTCEDFHKRR